MSSSPATSRLFCVKAARGHCVEWTEFVLNATSFPQLSLLLSACLRPDSLNEMCPSLSAFLQR